MVWTINLTTAIVDVAVFSALGASVITVVRRRHDRSLHLMMLTLGSLFQTIGATWLSWSIMQWTVNVAFFWITLSLRWLQALLGLLVAVQMIYMLPKVARIPSVKSLAREHSKLYENYHQFKHLALERLNSIATLAETDPKAAIVELRTMIEKLS